MREQRSHFWDAAAVRWADLGLPDEDDVLNLIERLGCESGATILDVGCGAGRWSVALASHGYAVRGVDITSQMVAAAPELAQSQGIDSDRAHFEVGDAEHLMLPAA